MKIEQQRLVNYENLIYDYFDHHTIISEQDRRFIYHSQRDKIAVIRNGVDKDYFEKKDAVIEHPVLLFTGNMSYPPNIDCAVFLAKEVFPIIQKSNPEVELRLAGASPHPDVAALATDKVIVTGWVEDIREEYSKAQVFLAPMRIGTGLQNKLLEAMSMEIPCITSSLANNALGATDQENIVLASQAEEVAEAVLKLLKEPQSAKHIAIAGKKYVEENFTWESTVKELEKIILSKSTI
ncbi:MAG: glycosyltransferase [Flavobacteriales bacterium]|nr:glycosyltransferase [Flavobacteriales bacterium]